VPTYAELLEFFREIHNSLGWALMVGESRVRLRVRAYLDGREWSACMMINGFEMEITGRPDDKGALGWTSETWIEAEDTRETVEAAAMVTAEDLRAQAERCWSGIAA
jgi:hypothetical protein